MQKPEIKFLELAQFWTQHWADIQKDLASFVTDGCYIGGNRVSTFEKKFAHDTGAEFGIGVGNGLDALKIALRCLNLPVGANVIVPTNTFVATWFAVTDLGLNIVPVEPNWATHVLDVPALIPHMNKNIAAVVLVTLYGNSPDISAIEDLCEKYGVRLVIDAAQSHGTVVNERKLGTFADFVCYSFYPGKTLGALGDAGIITTNKHAYYSKAEKLRNYGSSEKYKHDFVGYNSRLDPIQVVMLNRKLHHLDTEIDIRRKQVDLYNQLIQCEQVELVQVDKNVEPSWHLAVGRFKKRDALQLYLANNGIETLIHYPTPCHLQRCYSDQFTNITLSETEKNSAELLSLPLGSHLCKEEIITVSTKIIEFYAE